MEQLEHIVYRFKGFARNKDGGLVELSVAISAPADSGKGDSVCLLSFPLLREKPFSIYGVDHDQALELSRRFVEIGLENQILTLVNTGGRAVDLPPVPKADTLA